jgi:hypothetical protein
VLYLLLHQELPHHHPSGKSHPFLHTPPLTQSWRVRNPPSTCLGRQTCADCHSGPPCSLPAAQWTQPMGDASRGQRAGTGEVGHSVLCSAPDPRPSSCHEVTPSLIAQAWRINVSCCPSVLQEVYVRPAATVVNCVFTKANN